MSKSFDDILRDFGDVLRDIEAKQLSRPMGRDCPGCGNLKPPERVKYNLDLEWLRAHDMLPLRCGVCGRFVHGTDRWLYLVVSPECES